MEVDLQAILYALPECCQELFLNTLFRVYNIIIFELVDERVYAGFHRVVGRRRIGAFIESLVRPQVIGPDLAAAYRAMAAEESREE
jgi:hypothetical protein